MVWGINGVQITIGAGELAEPSGYNRCLVPASRFELSNCEWEDCIWELSQPDGSAFCFAGIYRQGPRPGFAIITSEREVFSGGPVVHMPLVLEPRAYTPWFDRGELPDYQSRMLRCDALVCV